jgi:hypothetical protein
MGLHEHSVFLEAINAANESDWLSHELHDLVDAYEGVRLSVNLLDFLCHSF